MIKWLLCILLVIWKYRKDLLGELCDSGGLLYVVSDLCDMRL